MDDIVKQALKKWPNVPHCYGWLALDARGEWYLRDDQAQAAGPFPSVKGSRVDHEKLRDFIARNYMAEAPTAGASDGVEDVGANWFFQNGPQRVYVELEAAPWVWRLQASDSGSPTIASHTGLPAKFESMWLDETGRVFIACDLGFGIVHTLDTEIAADCVSAGGWSPTSLDFDEMPKRFGYRLKPG